MNLLTGRAIQSKTTIGIGVLNNNSEDKNISFLGLQNTHSKHKGIELYSLSNGLFSDDNNLTFLQNYINAVGMVGVSHTRILNSELSLNKLADELQFIDIDSIGQQTRYFIMKNKHNYVDYKQFAQGIVNVSVNFIIKCFSSFTAHIPANSLNCFQFVIDFTKYTSMYEEKIKESYSIYDDKKKKTFLFLM